MSEIKFDKELDCSGMMCPIPIRMITDAIIPMKTDEILKVIATDPGTVRDITAWSFVSGNELLESETAGPIYTYYIKRR